MATITAQITNHDDTSITVLWETLTATNNVGSNFIPPAGYKLGAVNIVGTFGGAVTLAASADGTNFGTAEDCASVAVSATAAAFFNMGGATARAWHPTAAAGVSDVDVAAHFVPDC